MGKDETKVECLSFMCMCVHAFDGTCTWAVRLKGVRAKREKDEDEGKEKKENERAQIERRRQCGCL